MKNLKIIIGAIGNASVVLALSGPAGAQELPAAEFAALLENFNLTAARKNVYLPGVNHAVVAPSGTVFASATFMNPRDGNAGASWDASSSLGVGFGNAANGIGGSIQVNVTGTQPFGTDGDLTLKFSRQVLSSTYIGLGINRLAGWGLNASIDTNAEFMVTHFTALGTAGSAMPMTLTAGVSSVGGVDSSQNEPGAFLGIGVGLTEYVGIGASWKQGVFSAGFGVTVPNVDGLSVTVDMSNINAPNNLSQPIFSVGVHYAFDDLF